MGPFLVSSIAAVTLTAWQVHVDRSVFERFFGAADPVVVMTGVAVVGTVAYGLSPGISDFAVLGPGTSREAVSIIAWAVPLLAVAAMAQTSSSAPPKTPTWHCPMRRG